MDDSDWGKPDVRDELARRKALQRSLDEGLLSSFQPKEEKKWPTIAVRLLIVLLLVGIVATLVSKRKAGQNNPKPAPTHQRQ